MNTFALVDYLTDLLVEEIARESDVAQGKVLADNGANVSSGRGSRQKARQRCDLACKLLSDD